MVNSEAIPADARDRNAHDDEPDARDEGNQHRERRKAERAPTPIGVCRRGLKCRRAIARERRPDDPHALDRERASGLPVRLRRVQPEVGHSRHASRVALVSADPIPDLRARALREEDSPRG